MGWGQRDPQVGLAVLWPLESQALVQDLLRTGSLGSALALEAALEAASGQVLDLQQSLIDHISEDPDAHATGDRTPIAKSMPVQGGN